MNRTNPWNSYRQIATQTAPPGQLVLMLYEGAIKFLERAMNGFAIDDPSDRNQTINNNIMRAQDIVRELNYSLNLKEGGAVAANLQSLYEYFDRRLEESNLKKQDEGIKEVITRLSVLRDAWSAMLRGETMAQPGMVESSRPQMAAV